MGKTKPGAVLEFRQESSQAERKHSAARNLTTRVIERLPLPRTNRAVYRDSRTPGLGVMIQRSGHRSFFWFRKVRERPTWKHIGIFPALSVADARAEAGRLNTILEKWKASAYEDEDPFRHRPDLTLGAVFEDYVAKHRKARAKNPDRAVREDRWTFGAYLAHWRDRKLGSIRRSDVRALHADLGDSHSRALLLKRNQPRLETAANTNGGGGAAMLAGSAATPAAARLRRPRQTDGRFTANRVVEFVSRLFNWASRTEIWKGENPAKGVLPFAESSRTRFLLPHELPGFFRALSQERNLDLRDFVLLSLFTGARKSNTLAMRWDQLELNRGLWSIPDPKNRVPYKVPLMREAIEILIARRRMVLDANWVFPSKRSRQGHLSDVKHSWKALLAREKISDLRIHDLRRTLGSWQAGAGVSLPIIGKTLGHQSGDATQVYARLHLDPVRDAIRRATQAMFASGKVPRKKLLEAGRP